MTDGLTFLALLLVSAVFTGVEAALLSLSKSRVRHYARQGSSAAQQLEHLLERPHRLFLSILVITNVCNIAALAMLVRFCSESLGPKGYFVAGLTAIPLWLLLLGVIPKGLFRRMPFRTLSALVQPLEFCTRLLHPLTSIFERVAAPLAQIASGGAHVASREELKFFADASEQAGQLSPLERAMIHDVLDFRNLTAEAIMIPWERVVAITLDTPRERIIEIARQHALDRLPVLDAMGRAAGLVLTLDVLLDATPPKCARDFLRHVVSVQLREPAHRVIRKLRAARVTLAIVHGESSAPRGIVTSEDLVARLVQTAAKAASLGFNRSALTS